MDLLDFFSKLIFKIDSISCLLGLPVCIHWLRLQSNRANPPDPVLLSPKLRWGGGLIIINPLCNPTWYLVRKCPPPLFRSPAFQQVKGSSCKYNLKQWTGVSDTKFPCIAQLGGGEIPLSIDFEIQWWMTKPYFC